MDDPAVTVAENLDLDMATTQHVALDIDARVAERGACLCRSQLNRVRQFLNPVDALHAATSATTNGLDEERRAYRLTEGEPLGHGCNRATWDDRYVGRERRGACAELVPDSFDLPRGRSDEDNAVFLAALG